MQHQKITNELNASDILVFFSRRWYWFVASVSLCMGIAFYSYCKKPLIYRSSATIIIKDPSKSQASVKLDNYSNMINRVNLSNEIMQLESASLMREVVQTLHANINYTKHVQLRDIELYTHAPVEMVWLGGETDRDEVFHCTVQPGAGNTIGIEVDDEQKRELALFDTLDVQGNKLLFKPTKFYQRFLGQKIDVTRYPVHVASQAYTHKIKVKQVEEESSILEIVMLDNSLLRANDILNTLVQKYNEDALREKRQIAVNTAQFINSRLEIIEKELGEVESDLVRFQRREQLLSVEGAAAEYLAGSKTIQKSIDEVESQLRVATSMEQYLEGAFSRNESLPMNTSLEGAQAFSEAVGKYNELILRRERLLQAGSQDSPAVKQLDRTLAVSQNSLRKDVRLLISSLNEKKAELDAKDREAIRKFTSMPPKARKLISIERRQKIKESLYMFLLNRREENALTAAMADNNARIIGKAEGRPVPIFPSKNRTLLLGFLIGLFLPASSLMLFLLFDMRIRNRTDIEEYDLNFLAEMPQLKLKTKSKKDTQAQEAVVTEYDANLSHGFREAMRTACNNLQYMCPQECTSPVVMVTSFNAGAGKSFLSRNVSSCLADAGKKVILLDTDLRKRSVSAYFRMRHHTSGLAEFLADSTLPAEAIIHRNACPGVDFIPAGHIPPNPIELLSRIRFKELLETLKRQYDYILLDGTPITMVADSFAVSQQANITLFVMRCGVTDKRQLPWAVQLVKEQRLKNVCVLLNGIDKSNSYGYSYGYGYGYGYGNGYYESKDKEGNKA